MMWGNGYGGSWFGWVPMVLFWILLVLVVAALAKWLFGGPAHDRQIEKTALDILKERYARGEIDKDEFDQKKHDLEN